MSIENAREEARRAARDYYPDAVEVVHARPGMHDLDGIVLDPPNPIAMVNIMIDYDTLEFALVEVPRVEPDKSSAVEELLETASVRMMMCVNNTKTENELTAMYATLASQLSQSVRLKCEEEGWDVDAVRARIDRAFLEHPELQ